MITVNDFSDKNVILFKEAKKDNIDSLFTLLTNLLEADFPKDELIVFVKKNFKIVSKHCVDFIKEYNY